MLYRSNLLIFFSVALFSLLSFRLLQLQVIDHKKYSLLAKNNTTRVLISRAPRGIIYDRNDNILATNKQSLSVVVYPALLRTNKRKRIVAKSLSKILDAPVLDVLKIFQEMKPTTPLPITIDNDISVEQSIRVFQNYGDLPGIAVERQAIRFYPYGEIGAHFLGYVGQANSKELLKNLSGAMTLGDIVGKEGIEKVFDAKLRGVNGEERVPVDRYGRTLNAENVPKKIYKDAIRGEDFKLTIDIELQKVAQEAMGDMPGAVVVANPVNGEILALVSNPSFDPNIFTKPVPTALYRKLTETKAFLNRALSSYTPGSIWKPVTALSALENGVASRNEVLAVSGSIVFGGFRFGDWTAKEDMMNLPTAIAWSRNTYFYQIAKRMKPEWLSEIGEQLGAGQKTGIELQGESRGILPSPDWKKKRMKEEWYPGNTLHFAIGQSFLMLTPLQALKIISTIAMDGLVPNLHIVKDESKLKPEKKIEFKENSLNVVKEGLMQCIDSGTGVASKLKNIKLAGKTGSAEVSGYKRSTHGWFVAYGPADSTPEIAVAVFGEGAGHGGSVCAPVAKKIFDKFFENRLE